MFDVIEQTFCRERREVERRLVEKALLALEQPRHLRCHGGCGGGCRDGIDEAG